MISDVTHVSLANEDLTSSCVDILMLLTSSGQLLVMPSILLCLNVQSLPFTDEVVSCAFRNWLDSADL